VFDAIGQIFQHVIDFLQPILLPDWRALIDLLPVFLLIGVGRAAAQPADPRLVRVRGRQAALPDPLLRPRARARRASSRASPSIRSASRTARSTSSSIRRLHALRAVLA
jgi:hypothetical protein